MADKINIKELSADELAEIIVKKGFPAYRVKQIFHWLYQKKVHSFKEMNNLPQNLINLLESLFQLESLNCLAQQKSKDGAQKFLFQLKDKQLIESVLILSKENKKEPNKERNTICLSCQVGCQWHCLFCASGEGGFKRNLAAYEIVEQILSVQNLSGKIVHNVVFMGMGEPLDNYEQLMRSINIMNDKPGMNIGARKITISTCGIIPGIKKLVENPLQIELSVSLHAAHDNLRNYLMPVNRKYPLTQLIPACREYVKRKNRQITFEYLMLKGINDSVDEAQKLSQLISDFEAKVNLIIYNPLQTVQNEANLFPSDKGTVYSFLQILKKSHIPVTVRYSKGQDIQAACGQLKGAYLNSRVNLNNLTSIQDWL
jgi:23S rRNA (adenine2503-C2)-methyltransferase